MTNATANANIVLEALATAFGGWSQFPNSVVGAAIFGHFNNGGNAAAGGVTPEEVMGAAAALIAERWGHCGVEVAPTRVAIQGGFDAARAAIGGRA